MRLLLLITFLTCFFHQQSLQHSEQKPKVSVFFEPLCPYCTPFITNVLHPVYLAFESYIKVEFNPYGNTQRQLVNGTWTYECQHGSDECAIAKLEACGIAKASDQTQQMEYLYCIEDQLHNTVDINILAKCSVALKMNEHEILNCAKGPKGDELFGLFGDKQLLLAQGLDFVPAVYVNYKLLDDRNELKDVLCQLLHNKPKACH